jgi:hypothetical protein
MITARRILFGLLAFFALRLAYDGYTCYTEFCPGDREDDWVFETKDEDGNRVVMVNGNPVPLDQWQKERGIGPYSKDRQ